jgi:hypothetical protein
MRASAFVVVLAQLLALGCSDDASDGAGSAGWHHVDGEAVVDAPNRGSLTLFNRTGVATGNSFGVLGGFPLHTPVRDCRRKQVDACTVTSCEAPENAGSTEWAYAGTLNIDAPDKQLSIPYHSVLSYVLGGDGVLWQQPGPIGVSTTGGSNVPAFDQTLAAPRRVVVDTPAHPPAEPLVVARETPLEVRWSGDAPETTVRVGLWYEETTDTLERTTHVVCDYPAALGAASVPAEALRDLPAAGPPEADRLMTISVLNAIVFTNGAWSTHIEALEPASDVDGRALQLDVSYE